MTFPKETRQSGTQMEYLTAAWNSAVVVLLILLFQIVRRWKVNPSGLPRPPGPRGLPLVGNMVDLPKESPWPTVDKWFSEHDGDNHPDIWIVY